MNNLIFSFTATECNGWPKLKFWLGEALLLDFEFDSDHAEILLPLDSVEPGIYNLEIERYGKMHNHCLVENNNIIRDQTVTLKDIYIDDVKLPSYIKYSGVFCFDGVEHAQSLVWGPNGKFKMSMGVPAVNWAVQQKINNSRETLNLFIPLPEARKRFLENLDQFEKELVNVKT